MAKSSTTFSKDTQPPRSRGKAFKTLLLESIREESLIGLNPDSTKEDAEKAYLKHVSKRAFNVEDPNSATLLKTLMDKSYSNIKPSAETIQYELDAKSSIYKKAEDTLKAISEGKIPPDTGKLILDSITNLIKIKEVTEIEDRIKVLEDAKPQD